MQGTENEKRTAHAVENLGAGLGIAFFAAVVIFCFGVWPAIFGGQIGDYPAQRLEDGILMPLNRTIYEVNPLMQTIIYWMPSIHETPRKLVNCAVRDRKNWIGYYSDGSGAVEMRKGRIVTGDPNEIYIGRCRWWLLHVGLL